MFGKIKSTFPPYRHFFLLKNEGVGSEYGWRIIEVNDCIIMVGHKLTDPNILLFYPVQHKRKHTCKQ